MSIPAGFILYKNGKRVPIYFRGKFMGYHLPWNASYTMETGLDHIKTHLKDLKEDYDFDAIQSTLDGKIFYLTHEGFVDNEILT